MSSMQLQERMLRTLIKQYVPFTGLWEFPSVLLEDAAPADRAKRRAAINDYLRDTLELFPDAMSERRDIGDVSHTFSHIQMTLDVEMMSVKVRSLRLYEKTRCQTPQEHGPLLPLGCWYHLHRISHRGVSEMWLCYASGRRACRQMSLARGFAGYLRRSSPPKVFRLSCER